jgi:hypothetical protein
MSYFSDFVHICPLDDLGVKIMEDYQIPLYENGRCYGHRLGERDINKSFFEQLDPTKFVQSSVGKGKDTVVNPEVRSSKIWKKSSIRIRPKYELADLKIYSTKIIPLKDSLECSFTYNYDLIKYEIGDHFNEYHYDTFRGDNVATLLIFPPKSMSGEYIGGDLVFKIDDVEHRIITSRFDEKFPDKFVCVIFGNVLHKCEPVTSGIRYVIKSNIKARLPNILSDIKRFKLSDIIKDIDNDELLRKQREEEIRILEEDEQKLKSILLEYNMIKTDYVIDYLPDNLENTSDYNKDIKIKLNKLHQEYKELKQSINTRRVNNTPVDIYNYKLNDKKYNICVLPYFIKNMDNLLEYNLDTRRYIKKKIEEGWNVTYMYKEFSFKTEYEDGYRQLDGGYDDYDDYNPSNDKYNLLYELNFIDNGECVDYHSEYNDQSGDDIYEEYKCSCLLIWKE